MVQRWRVQLHRRWPILAWRTVRLDRVPNPTVLAALIAANVGAVRVHDPLLVLLDSAAGAPSGQIVHDHRAPALRNMLVGGLLCVSGLVIIWTTLRASSSFYVVAYGPILYGGTRFFRGLSEYFSKRHR